jgi:hypothetical protein
MWERYKATKNYSFFLHTPENELLVLTFATQIHLKPIKNETGCNRCYRTGGLRNPRSA